MTAQASMTRRSCRWITLMLLTLYLIALGLFLTGTLGLFGAERDPLSGVFLMPLGLPWNMSLNILDVPAPVKLLIGVLSPVLNLIILRIICWRL